MCTLLSVMRANHTIRSSSSRLTTLAQALFILMLGFASAKDSPSGAAGPPSKDNPVATAFIALRQKLPEAEALLTEGKWMEAKELLANVHPEKGRTIAQQQALASIMYFFDPEKSYQLHKTVAAAQPTKEIPNFIWAVEQHRVGQWKGALESYKIASKLNPDYAPTYGLAAECALQLGLLDEAVQLWLKSEKAEIGTVEEFETEICKIHGPQQPYREREKLVKRVEAGHAASAVELVAMDLDWRKDWWNGGPNIRHLKFDITLIEKLALKRDREIAMALLAARLSTLEPTDKTAKKLIENEGLLSSKPELPSNGRILSHLVTYIEEHKFATKGDLREKWGHHLEKLAGSSSDPEVHNARAWLYLDRPELPEIDLKGWEMSNDPRFAGSYLGGQMESGKLKLGSKELQKAVNQFPNACFIQNLAFGLTAEGTDDHKAALIALIKADFAHLPSAGLLGRASANPLRAAFARLVEIVSPKDAH